MAEQVTATHALLLVDRRGIDDRTLAERICRACITGLDVDGAVLSLLTATVSRMTLWASPPPS